MPRKTISFRLIASSTIWVAASFLAAGLLLVLLFRDHIERRFDARLQDHLEELVAASELAPDGAFRLMRVPSDPRYNRPLSGWYWQIIRKGEAVAQSGSLWRNRLKTVVLAVGTGPQVQEFLGPEKRPLRALVESITLPEARDHVIITVAGPVSDIERDVGQFSSNLAITLGVLGVGLVGAVLFQVRFGLRPLRALEGALSDIRAGTTARLPETFPAEIQPLVGELNALLDHNTTVLERYRTQTGNLAHALKNPLTVIGNEIRNIEGERGKLLQEQAAIVSKLIDRHLSRARAAGSGAILRARTSVQAAVEDIRFSMVHLYRDRGLEIRVTETAGLWFKGDAEDLEEMMGNLIDNACKWARSTVMVSGKRSGARIRIKVEDDGPGIPEERRTEVLKRGGRLDLAVQGSGLGLGIVQDVAELYGGWLTLEVSPLGGLSAELELPSADEELFQNPA